MSLRSGPSHLLPVQEEKILVDWIEKCKRRGFPRRKKEIMQGAHSLLKRRQNNLNIKCPVLPGSMRSRAETNLSLEKQNHCSDHQLA